MAKNVRLPMKTTKVVYEAFAKSRGAKRAAVLDEWSKVYAAEMRARYSKFSRGGGNWPSLAASTLARRRGSGRGVAILIDTAVMFAAFAPRLVAVARAGLIVASASFGATGSYPDGTSLLDVMTFHQTGGPNLPRRTLLVAPSAASMRIMISKLKKILLPRK